MTKEGLKRIDSIQEGEFVLSKNTKTGQLDYKKVLYVYRKSTRKFTNLIVAGRLIETTPTHLFMLEDGNWRSAENLKAGDRIVTANGKVETVDSVEEKHYNEARRIYNLNVDEFHTYFVGADELLVHNNCSEEMVKRIIEAISSGKIEHILTDHTYGRMKTTINKMMEKGLRQQAENLLNKKSFFNPSWSEQEVIDATNQAYNKVLSQGWTNGNHTVKVFDENITVYLENGVFHTAYGDFKLTLSDFGF